MHPHIVHDNLFVAFDDVELTGDDEEDYGAKIEITGSDVDSKDELSREMSSDKFEQIEESIKKVEEGAVYVYEE